MKLDEIAKIQDQQLSEAKKSQEHFHFAQQTEGAGEKEALKALDEEIQNDYKG